MCVILICPARVRPDQSTLNACHAANPHGAGVAWRDAGQVRWRKGLAPADLGEFIADLSGEIVIHFRWASVGRVTPQLCHPFPVSSRATTRLSGHARAVLFHNGTWPAWRRTLQGMPRQRVPEGELSDSRVAASLAALCGSNVLARLPGRYVFFGAHDTEVFGDWQRWKGMQASNLGFVARLPRALSFSSSYTQSADRDTQPYLPF